MGNSASLSDAWPWSTRTTARLLLTGLDASGKTSIVQQLLFAHRASDLPSLHEPLRIKAHELEIELHSEDLVRQFAPALMSSPQTQSRIPNIALRDLATFDAICFTVDSSERAALHDARAVFDTLLAHKDLSLGAPIIILVTKQDVSSGLSVEDVARAFGVESLSRRSVCVMGVAIDKKQTMEEALTWVCSAIKRVRSES